MASRAKRKYIVLSDMHFGMKQSSVNDRRVLERLALFLAEQSPIEAVVFSGDLLDLNLSTFTRAIEGYHSRGIVGFREFLQILERQRRPSSVDVRQWIYVPGNHDYRIWDILSTNVACVDVLAAGASMRARSGPLKTRPLKRWRWAKGTAFVAGIFPPGWRRRVVVEYPDCELGSGKQRVVVTHGHYLDPWQTAQHKLRKLSGRKADREQLRKLFVATAAYQTIAGCVSFTDATRKGISALFGPGGLASLLGPVKEFLLGKSWKAMLVSPLRGKGIDEDQLLAIEHYLRHFRRGRSVPRYVVFGHTHVAGHDSTKSLAKRKRLFAERDIEVYNAGAFYPRGRNRATLLGIEIAGMAAPTFRPYRMDQHYDIVAGD